MNNLDQNDISETIKNLRNRLIKPDHEGDYWSDEDKASLKFRFDNGYGISEMAIIYQRSESAICQQIEKMDLYGRKRDPMRQKALSLPRSCSLCNRNCRCPLCDNCEHYRKIRKG